MLILFCAKFAAYNWSPLLAVASARPVNTAPGTVALVSALPMFGSRPGAHASMWPVMVEKMNRAGALTPLRVFTKPVPPLATCPVGSSGVSGNVTRTAATFAATVADGATEESVATSEAVFADHNGDVGSSANPQGLTRSGSVMDALPGTSDTRFTWCTPNLPLS